MGTHDLPGRTGGFKLAAASDPDPETKLTVWVKVEPAGLSIKTGGKRLDGSPPLRGIHVPELHLLEELHASALRILSLSVGSSLTTVKSAGLRPQLLAESPEDEDRLGELGASSVWVDTWASWAPRLPRIEPLDDDTLRRLLDREIGIALYLDARRMSSAPGSFREFWRVLESAFGEQDDRLVALITRYPPAADLQFDAQELKHFLVLRGRASHAESSAGLDEYHSVAKLAAQAMPRLRTLVELVLLTKRSWGTRGLAVEMVAPLRSYITKSGDLVAIPRSW